MIDSIIPPHILSINIRILISHMIHKPPRISKMSPLFLLPILLLHLLPQTQSTTQTYIIHTQPSTHLLHSLSSTSSPPPHLLYTYSHSATGFAARLTPVQAAELTRHPTVLSVSPDRVHQLHTTHTPDFSGLWPNSGYASDVIVGVLDSGIWPEIPSFNDDGEIEVQSAEVTQEMEKCKESALERRKAIEEERVCFQKAAFAVLDVLNSGECKQNEQMFLEDGREY